MKTALSAKRLACKNYVRPAIIAVAILLVPLITMQFSSEVAWGPGDFVLMGGLLYVTGLGMEFVVAKAKTWGQRVILSGAILLGFLALWAFMAVGTD